MTVLLAEKESDAVSLSEESSAWRKLSEAAADLAGTLNRRTLAPRLIYHACQLLAAEKAVLVLKETGGWGYRLYRWQDGELVTDGEFFLEVRGLVAEILTDGLPRAAMHGEAAAEVDYLGASREIIALPLKVDGFLLGVLAVADKAGGGAFSSADRDLLRVLAVQGALALENAWLYEQADERLQEKVAELHTLNLMLRGQQSLLQRSADLYQQLTELVLTGQGLEAICQALYQVVHAPLVVENEQHQVLMRLGMGENERHISLRDLPAGHAPSRRVAVCRKATRFNLEGGPFRAQIVVPLVAGQEILGYLYALENERPLGTLEQMALENAGTVLCLELLKTRVAWETELRLRADFLEKVLSGAYAQEGILEAQARRLGLSLRGEYQVLLLQVGPQGAAADNVPHLDRAFQVVTDLLPQYGSRVFLTSDGRHLVIIAPAESETARRHLEGLATETLARLEANELEAWCALSGIGKGPTDLRRVYGEALTVLEIMQAIGRKKRLMRHADLGVFGMLAIDRERFIGFARRILGPIIDYERQHRLNLLETLDLYYRNNCNLQQTARAGYLSLSTLKYRLRRIREIGGLDLDDPETRLQVQLALRLLL